MIRPIRSVMLLAIALPIMGCKSDEPAKDQVTSPPANANEAPAPTDDILRPAGVENSNDDQREPASPGARPQNRAAGEDGPRAPSYTPPDNWQARPPSRAMRAAEFTIPRAEGDNEDGQMVVYYFGANQGGGIQANMDRWRNMFTTGDGAPVDDSNVQTDTLETNGLTIHVIDVQGRYTDRMSRPDQIGRASCRERG